MHREQGIGVAIVAASVAILVVLSAQIAMMPSASHVVRLPLTTGWGRVGFFSVSFEVAAPGQRLVGSWYAPTGGFVAVHWANETGPEFTYLRCMISRPWNGTIDQTLMAGLYTMNFFTGGRGARTTITDTLRLTQPAGANETHLYFDGSGCSGS